MLTVRSGVEVVARIILAGLYDQQDVKGEDYVENGRVVSVRSGTASQGGGNLANPTKFRQEIYIDDAGLLVVSQDWEMPYRIEEEEVVLSGKKIVKARRMNAEDSPGLLVTHRLHLCGLLVLLAAAALYWAL